MSPGPASPPSASEVTLTSLPVSAVARFHHDANALVARLGGVDDDRFALAVSGGADSMAMLRLAAAAWPGQVSAATFDHQLRDGSAAEAAMVASVCATLGVPHATLRPVTPITGNSIQLRARTVRYAALGQWAQAAGIRFLLTAHHADDQAETLLMRLQRASGLSGLAAIRSVRVDAFGAVLRPLLGWRRTELRALAEESGTPFVDDPSNDDPRHDRTKVRALLAANPALDAAALAMSARYLAEADEVIGAAAERVWAAGWRGPAAGFRIDDEPREVRRRLVRRALDDARRRLDVVAPPFDPDSANVEALLDALAAGKGATQAGIMVRAGAQGWIFSVPPPRRSL